MTFCDKLASLHLIHWGQIMKQFIPNTAYLHQCQSWVARLNFEDFV